MHGAVSIHRGESCAAACKQQRRGSVFLSRRREASLTPACMASTGTAQHRIALHRIASQAVSIERPSPWSTQCYGGSDQRHARTGHDKHKAGRRIMDCSQLAPASHFFSFACMRIRYRAPRNEVLGLELSFTTVACECKLPAVK